MKIKGFTLAEVLIVLMVLGVIAMLTLPALNANVQKQQAGPALMRAISTLETANALMSQDQEFYNFSESCNNYLTDCFEPFVKEKIGASSLGDDVINYTFLNNPTQGITYSNGFITNNGFIYYVDNTEFSNQRPFINIYIDINGTKRPNVVGKDLFYVILSPDAEGSKLYAAGSTADVEMFPDSLYSRSGHWKDYCNDSEVTNAVTCAGSIVDNGGKVIYPWN